MPTADPRRELRDALAAAYDEQPWHGPSFRRLLHGLTPAQAAARPVAGAHSVWEIVLHVGAWMTLGAERLRTLTPVPMDLAADWPPVPASLDAAAWRQALRALDAAYLDLVDAVDALAPDALARPMGVPDAPQGTGGTAATLGWGLVQHLAYHGGQVALLRRALGVPA